MSTTLSTRVALPALVLLLGGLGAWSADRPPAAPADPLDAAFPTQVRPFLDRYCASCHGPKKPKAALDLSGETTAAAVVHNPQRWEQILERLHAGEMPPADAARRPADAERAAVVDWVRAVRAREAK